MVARLSLLMVVACPRWFQLKSPVLSSRAGVDPVGTQGFYALVKDIQRSCKKDKARMAFRKYRDSRLNVSDYGTC
jgi:hypothetical protein